jgi:hypothetical protein
MKMTPDSFCQQHPASQWWRSGISVLVFAAILGCGPGNKARVTGRITLDGQPLDKVLVMFVPDAGPSSGGVTDQDGRYELVSGPKHGKNVFTGRCRVYLTESIEDPTKPPPPSRFAAKYLSAESSGLECELKPGPSVIDFDITNKN